METKEIGEVRKAIAAAKALPKIEATDFILDKKNRCTWWVNGRTGQAGLHMRWDEKFFENKLPDGKRRTARRKWR